MSQSHRTDQGSYKGAQGFGLGYGAWFEKSQSHRTDQGSSKLGHAEMGWFLSTYQSQSHRTDQGSSKQRVWREADLVEHGASHAISIQAAPPRSGRGKKDPRPAFWTTAWPQIGASAAARAGETPAVPGGWTLACLGFASVVKELPSFREDGVSVSLQLLGHRMPGVCWTVAPLESGRHAPGLQPGRWNGRPGGIAAIPGV